MVECSMKVNQLDIINQFAKQIKKKILFTSLNAGASSSHFGGSLSTVDIISTLYSSVMNIDKNDPQSINRDRFILSKGHGCLAYYAALTELGWLTEDDLRLFEKEGAKLLGHPVINRSVGIEFSNGSLGMGLSIGIGLGIAFKRKNRKNKIFVLMGDGECNEGSVWEAAMSCPNFDLDNITAIIDNNGFQQTGSNKEIMNSEKLADKWKSFGWEVISIDGHNVEQLVASFNTEYKGKPKVIIAKTIKGKGFSFSENNNDWHHAVLTQKQYDQAMKELND